MLVNACERARQKLIKVVMPAKGYCQSCSQKLKSVQTQRSQKVIIPNQASVN